MKTFRLPLLTAWLLCICLQVSAAEPFISFAPADDALALSTPDLPLTIVSDDDSKGVDLALDNLLEDFERVTGRRPELRGEGDGRLLVGTVGHSRIIDRMIRNKQIPGKELKGKREKYLILPVEGSVVIAGSDRRGTIYGIYELSRQIGISPWYWWADVPAEHHEAIGFVPGQYTDGEPVVEYRGIFINDEWPAFGGWTTEKFGGFNSRMYEHVFELILRLKGNFMWPAMWSGAFYADDAQNSVLADRMGVIVGTSHHEPMARNHQEYARNREKYGAWNYETNQASLDAFFSEGIRRARNTEDVITIGMRGDGDEAMGRETNIALLERIVANQRKIIARETGKKPEQVPQVWALYKEVQTYYEEGMRVPDDVILLLCDDNWGNVRLLPDLGGEKHKGGYGMYYHVDYVGGPRNYKWINVSQIQRMWEQLQLTAGYGVDRLWILNVGDLKPMEFPIDFFMEMAWNPSKFTAGNLTDYTERFCAAQFGACHAKEAARILNLQGKYAHRCTPELLNAGTYTLDDGQWKLRCDEYKHLEADALNQYLSLPDRLKDAYKELILFPVQGMANLYDMYYAYARGDEARARACYEKDSLLCDDYNRRIADGKWNHMMDQIHIGYTYWQQPDERCFPSMASQQKTLRKAAAQKPSVILEAGQYAEAIDAAKAKWTLIPDFGKYQDGIALMPYTEATDGAQLSYDFFCEASTVEATLLLAPSFPFNGGKGQRLAVKVDDSEAIVLNINARLQEEYWEAQRINRKTLTLNLPSKRHGWHRLTLSPLDPGIVLERIELTPAAAGTPWIGTWATAEQLAEPHNTPPAPYLENHTLRQIIQTSVGGETARLKLSNEFSQGDAEIKEVSIALACSAGSSRSVIEESRQTLSFKGQKGVVMKAGETAVSDPFTLSFGERANLAIDIRYGKISSENVTSHPGSRTTSYLLEEGESDWDKAVETNHWYTINALEVERKGHARAVVVLGNSITDGRGSTTNAQDRWTDNLSRRLLANEKTRDVTVLNMGLGGNCVLQGGLGPTGRSRYVRDLFGQEGVKYIILFEGINDLGNSSDALRTADGLIAQFSQIAEEAHGRGIKVYGATITPFKGNSYYSDDHEQGRQRFNEWVRTTPLLDAFIDFDQAVRSASDPSRLDERYLYENDWLHPNALGYRVMADGIDLSLFER